VLGRTMAALAILSVFVSTGLAHETTESQYNFGVHVRPIFVKHCGGCHRSGGVAPMSLLEYSEAVPWVNAIKMQVLERTMPPWLPADEVGMFRHSRSLSAEEIDILIDWAIGLTPEGDPLNKDELATAPAATWTMGEPDLILTPPEDLVIGEDDYELEACTVMPTDSDQALVATAFEVRPVLEGLLRRATIRLGSSCDDGLPLATWVPGQGSVELPAGVGHAIPAGAELAVSFLYVKGWEDEGKRLTDRSDVGIRFTPGAERASAVQLSDTSHAFDDDVELLALFPPASGVEDGASFSAEVVLPDGRSQPLILIEAFQSAWSEKYLLKAPVTLPAGSQLRMSHPAAWVDFRVSASTADDE